jgi:hypothetical protein
MLRSDIYLNYSMPSVANACVGFPSIEEPWDKFGTKIVSMGFISVHIERFSLGYSGIANHGEHGDHGDVLICSSP